MNLFLRWLFVLTNDCLISLLSVNLFSQEGKIFSPKVSAVKIRKLLSEY